MPSCIVKNCNSNWRMKEISFHMIPKQNYEAWLKVLHLNPKTWMWNKNLKVCSIHFEEKWFDRTGQVARLKEGAVPSLHLPIDEESTESCSSMDLDDIQEQREVPDMKEESLQPPSTAIEMMPSTSSMNTASFEKQTTYPLQRIQSSSSLQTTSSEGTTMQHEVNVVEPRAVEPTHSSSSLKTTSSEGRAKRRKFIATIHNYSCSPGKYKRRLTQKQSVLRQCKKKLWATKLTVRKLKNKIQSFQQIIKVLEQKKLVSENASEHLHLSLSGVPKLLFNRIVKNKERGSLSREEYPPEIKKFAMTLQFYSTKAYEYVRETLDIALPHLSTIRRWYSGVECEPGFSKSAFDVLEAKATEYKKVGRTLLCAFLLDEMAIKTQIDWDGKKTWGYIDIGSEVFNDTLTPATEALVFMVVCHTEAWKLPIAYFLIKTLTGAEKANLINEALQRLHTVGVQITSVTCDGPSTHVTMMKVLGCQITDIHNIIPYFSHPSDSTISVYAIFDICHMIKLLRNCLASLGVIIDPDGNLIQWKFITLLYELEESEGLRAGTKLSKAHMQWQKQKMKVRLAVQTLSRSVADALQFVTEDLKLPQFQGSEATIKFIRLVDQLFDLLNSRSPFAKGFKGPLKPLTENEWRPFMMEAVHYLSNCKNVKGQYMYETTRKTPFIGFIVSTLSVIGIYDDYVKTQRILKYLLTYKCSQDHLEMFFASIRSRNGWNNNPSALQFKNSFKKLLFHAEAKGVGGNCVPLDTTTILQINAPQRCTKPNVPGFQIDLAVTSKFNMDIYTSVDHDYNIDYSPSLTDYVDNVVTYMSGYVLKMAPKYIKCETCLDALVSATHTCDDTSFNLMEKKERGGLLWASNGVRRICRTCESYIRRMLTITQNRVPKEEHYVETFVNIVSSQLYNLTLFPSLKDHFYDLEFQSNHVYLLIKTVCYCYLKIRLYNLCKTQTMAMKGDFIRHEFTKLVLFKHQ